LTIVTRVCNEEEEWGKKAGKPRLVTYTHYYFSSKIYVNSTKSIALLKDSLIKKKENRHTSEKAV
jgi:hypothetical protein